MFNFHSDPFNFRSDSAGEQPPRVSSNESTNSACELYELVEFLGSSGQAQIWLATEKLTKRTVIAKHYEHLPGIQEPVEHKRLELLNHPNIVKFLNRHCDGNNTWLYLELVEGHSLEETLSSSRSFDNAMANVELLEQVCEGLAHAHSKNILHLDLKPRNVMIEQSGLVKIIDFGSSEFHSCYCERPKQSDSGTFAYMAPERAEQLLRTSKATASAAADIYSVCAILYYALTGFNFRSSEIDLKNSALHNSFDRSPLVQLFVPESLRSICLRGLDTNPDNRPNSAIELAGLLRAARLELSGPKQKPTYMRLALIAVVLLTSILGLAVFANSPNPPESTATFQHLQDFVFDGFVNCAQYDSDSRSLVVGGMSGEIWLWPTIDNSLFKMKQVSTFRISDVAVSNGGRFIASIDQDAVLKVYDSSLNVLWETPLTEAFNLVSSDCGWDVEFETGVALPRLACATTNHIFVFEVDTGKLLKSNASESSNDDFAMAVEGIGHFCGFANSNQIVSADWSYRRHRDNLRIVSIATGESTSVPLDCAQISCLSTKGVVPTSPIFPVATYCGVARSSDGVLEMTHYPEIIACNFWSGEVLWRHQIKCEEDDRIRDLAVDASRRFVATAGDSSDVQVRQLNDGKTVFAVPGSTGRALFFASTNPGQPETHLVVLEANTFQVYPNAVQ